MQVYSLPPTVSPNTWLLNTHYDHLERRYGGWQFGVGRGQEQLGTAESITIVHYNNKVWYNARLREIYTFILVKQVLLWFYILHL